MDRIIKKESADQQAKKALADREGNGRVAAQTPILPDFSLIA